MMRLICPNCDAQYDVADDAIPPGGRDVQCSNCQVSWFQTEKPTVPGRTATPPVRTAMPEMTEEAATLDAEPEAPVDAADEEPDEAEIVSDEIVRVPDPTPRPERKPLDDAVASILREEAALGAAATVASAATPARAATPAPPPTTTTKPAHAIAIDETLQRIAQMTAEEGGTRSGAQPNSAKGKAATADEAHMRTVPSINEINATLRARAQANDTSGLTEAEKEEAVQRKGFRRGFFLVLLILAILILPYVFAEQITENLPQTSDAMGTYVTTVDNLRLQLNDLIANFRAN